MLSIQFTSNCSDDEHLTGHNCDTIPAFGACASIVPLTNHVGLTFRLSHLELWCHGESGRTRSSASQSGHSNLSSFGTGRYGGCDCAVIGH